MHLKHTSVGQESLLGDIFEKFSARRAARKAKTGKINKPIDITKGTAFLKARVEGSLVFMFLTRTPLFTPSNRVCQE